MHEKGNSMSNLDIEFICDKYDMIGSLIYAMVDYVPGYGSVKETHDRFADLFYILEEEFNNTTKEFHTMLDEVRCADTEDQNDSDKIDEMRVIIEMEMSRNVQSGNTQNLKSTVIQRSFPKWSVAERRKTAAASDQAAVCACAHSRYFAGGSPSGLRV